MRITEIMTSEVETCSPDTAIVEVAAIMKDLDVGSIPIVEDGHLKGTVTDRDIVVRGVAEDVSLNNPVSEILSPDVVTGNVDMSVEEAAELMAENQIRRLPIVEEDRLVGIVSLGDIAVKDRSNENTDTALENVSQPAAPDR
ncbi:CBS domain-containing protein [Lysinibacillus yapensis]|uniref:CBS domain-containing protein n=1 Tax=Ureibacillus yapensis TaxID=2304605 RepID=A0A396SFD1_9BACL|nr:CBS domain-containing protein [Lysinibacillus yapensis]RHW40044.1 CBS domain-containing protein [Lysinibacillus yapensis]